MHAALHQVRDKILVGIAGRDISVSIVGAIFQRHMAGVGVKDGNGLGFCFPLGDIILDKLHMEDRSRQISFERQGADTEYDLYTR